MIPDWLRDLGVVLLAVPAVFTLVFIAVLAPVGVLALVPAQVFGAICSGGFCSYTVGLVGVGVYAAELAAVAVLFDRGHLRLPDAW